VFPYSITPNYSDTPLLTGTVPANSSVYLPLGTIDFASFENYVTLEFGTTLPTGKCVSFDYERTLAFTKDEDCEITFSFLDRYLQKTVKKYTLPQILVGSHLIQPIKYLCSAKLTNTSSNELNYTLSLGQGFAIPYNMLYSAASFTKMLIYDGFPLVFSPNPPSIMGWSATIVTGKDLYTPVTITSDFSRPYVDFSPIFTDNSPYQGRPFNGERVLTMYTQHYGFGNLPTFATPNEQKSFLNGNNQAILGAKPFSDNFVPWFS
jgi:hypothetical protein